MASPKKRLRSQDVVVSDAMIRSGKAVLLALIDD